MSDGLPPCFLALVAQHLAFHLTCWAPLAPAGLVGDIIKRFEQRGYKLVGCKASCWPSAAQAAAPPTWHHSCCWCVTSAWHACAWHALPASHRHSFCPAVLVAGVGAFP